jgi:hypothetical protein
MTNKDKTGTLRQQRRREREKEWLKAHNLTSWEQLHTKLMSGEIALDTVTPSYSKPTYFDKAMARLQQGEYQSPKKKEK